MPLKYKVVSPRWENKNIFVEIFKITEQLNFQDYLKEVTDLAQSKEGVRSDGTKWFVFHPSRNYDNVEKNYTAYRIETGELWLIDKKHNAVVGDYVNYDPQIDELTIWDVEAAKQKPNLQLVES